MRRLFPCVAAALLVAACHASDAVDPSSAPATNLATGDGWEAAAAATGAMPIRVYQQNVYPGFNIDDVSNALAAVLSGSASPDVFLGALYVGMATLQATNWRERAARMAVEIEAQNADVVSLNEVVTVEHVGLENLYGPGTLPDRREDFLQIFREELARRNLPYKLVDTLPLTQAVIPISDFFGLPVTVSAAYRDRDAMFVRQNVGVADVTTHVFAVGLDGVVRETRGYISAELTLRGRTWRVIGSHPEPSWPAGNNPTQVQELLTEADRTELPVVLAGDLNLEPSSTWHAQLTGAGFIDLLQLQYGGTAAGNTCCQSDPALRNAAPTLVKRIDYVMARPADGYKLGPMAIEVFGDEAADRTATGMWPSDHAGLFAKLVMQKLQP